MKRKYRIAGVLAAALAGAAVYFYVGHQVPAGQPPLESLTEQNVRDVAAAFNRAKGEVRVVALLSPT